MLLSILLIFFLLLIILFLSLKDFPIFLSKLFIWIFSSWEILLSLISSLFDWLSLLIFSLLSSSLVLSVKSIL